MARSWTLVTCDYPPMKGGVASYLSDLVSVAKGVLRVIVPSSQQKRWWTLVGLMRNLLRVSEARVLISHVLPIGTAAWVASRLLNAHHRGKYIILFHGLDLRLSQKSIMKRWMTRWIVRGAARVCVNSERVANECRHAFPWVNPVVLTPGYNVHDLPSRDEARKSLGIRSDEVILLNVARLVSRKGLDRLIEVLPKLPTHVRAVSIGEGQDRERLEKLAQNLYARITFLGAIDDVIRDLWYMAADIFVFPVRDEVVDIEGYGMVCLEAAAAGLPVIVGKGGGAPETVVPEETGLVVDVEKPGELQRAIERLVADPDLRCRMGKRGRTRVLRDARWESRWEALSQID